MASFFDPRPTWDAREAELDKIESELEMYVKTAKEMGHKPTIDLTSARLAEHRKVRKDYRAARNKLDEAIDANKAAGDTLAKAELAEMLGTADAKTALANHHAVIVASAAMRYTAGPLAQLVASAAGMRERQSASITSAHDREVVTETLDLVRSLLEYKSPNVAHEAASKAGAAATAAKVAWWDLSEVLARREFKAKLREKKSEDSNEPADYRRAEPYFPTLDMLEACFTKRREAFNAERRRIESQLQQMTGALQNMGGAA